LDYDVAEETVNQILFKSDAADVLQNVVDYLYKYFDKYSWVGIYFVEGKYLVLGPWNGEQATEHTKIPIGKGVCGSAVQSGKTEVVADVSDSFDKSDVVFLEKIADMLGKHIC